tara:strand:- start:286 stop:1023 length:738 start_codon:yes stop_codon:yes gene_type:complete
MNQKQYKKESISNSICIIPARGGSKRIKRKNIRLFQGRPIIEWSIEAAKTSNVFSRIIVSTDNEQIATISQQAGAEVPFMRPKHLSDDYTDTRAVIEHAITKLTIKADETWNVCCLYATAPFVSADRITEGRKYLMNSKPGSVVFAATTFPFPIQRAIKLDGNGYSKPFDSRSIRKRSQDLEEFYHDAGQFYWAKASTWMNNINIFEKGRPLILPRHHVQDIDTEEDWKRAELMHKVLYTEAKNV